MNTYTITLKRADGTIVKSAITTTTQKSIYHAARSAGMLSAAKYAEFVEVTGDGRTDRFALLAGGRTIAHDLAFNV